jgi:hypothetical protein
VVDVVGEPHGDAALRRGDERVLDDLRGRRWETQVVERDVEAAVRAVEDVRDRVGDLVGGLTAVGERADLDQVFAARSAALCARFAAW